jgi:hypothetical protein
MKQVSGRLLSYLCGSCSSTELGYAAEPVPIALGAET